MTDRDIIRAEIERLKAKQLAIFSKGESEESCGDALTHIGAYNQLLSFINSLPEEPVSEELKEACEQLAENARKYKAETSSPFFSQTDYKQGVIDGAKWQKKQMKEALRTEYEKGRHDALEEMKKSKQC